MVCEVVRRSRYAAPLQIGGGGANHSLEINYPACGVRYIANGAGAERHVGVLSDQVYESICNRQFDFNIRIAEEKFWQCRRELMHPKSSVRVYVQPSTRGCA